VLARISHFVRGNLDFCHDIDQSINEFWEVLAVTILENWRLPLDDYANFITELHIDAAKFAGIEIVRRIVGLAHVKEIEELHGDLKLVAEKLALAIGSRLIKSEASTGFVTTLATILEEER
jgi:5-methylthioribose kinase